LGGATKRDDVRIRARAMCFMTTCDVRNDGAKLPVVVEIPDTYQVNRRVTAEKDDI
jgi:hypothetical protein